MEHIVSQETLHQATQKSDDEQEKSDHQGLQHSFSIQNFMQPSQIFD